MWSSVAVWCALALAGSSGAAGAGGVADTASSTPEPAARPASTLADVRFSGLMQAWYVDGNAVSPRSFRLRRAMLKFSGDLSASARWTVSVDPAKALKLQSSYADVGGTPTLTETRANQASRLLQDAYLSLSRGRVRVDVGQFRLPVGLEGGSLSSSKLETVERSLFASAGKLTQVRDVGAALRLALPAELGLTVGVFNGLGEGQNGTDGNAEKAVAGRLSYGTPVPGLAVGVSGAWGGESRAAVVRRRVGGDLTWASGPVRVRGEVLRATDGDLHRLGYYGLAAYRRGELEGVVRYDAYDPDVDATAGAAARIQDFLVGGSWFLPDSPVALKANYIRRDYEDGAAGQNLLMMALQAAW